MPPERLKSWGPRIGLGCVLLKDVRLCLCSLLKATLLGRSLPLSWHPHLTAPATITALLGRGSNGISDSQFSTSVVAKVFSLKKPLSPQ